MATAKIRPRFQAETAAEFYEYLIAATAAAAALHSARKITAAAFRQLAADITAAGRQHLHTWHAEHLEYANYSAARTLRRHPSRQS